MKTLTAIIFSFLIGTHTWGLTVDFDKYIRVSPTNAPSYGITFKYHHPNPSLVTIEMPYASGDAVFYEAILSYRSADQHFKIPVYGKKNEQENLFIAFWMDLDTLRQATLNIRFEEDGAIEGTVFTIECKDFTPEQKDSQQGGPAYPPQGVGSADP